MVTLLFYCCHTITVSLVTFNSKNGRGLGVVDCIGAIHIISCTFSNNKLSYYSHNDNVMAEGGGIIIQVTVTEGKTTYYIKDTYFLNNLAISGSKLTESGLRGGDLKVQASSSSMCSLHVMIVSQGFFLDNYAVIGGGLSTEMVFWYLYINNCTFKNNNAIISGGAAFIDVLYVDFRNHIVITKTNFESNKALYGGALSISGVIVVSKYYYKRHNSITVQLTNFTNNKAKGSAAIDISKKGLELFSDANTGIDFRGSLFVNNEAGVHFDEVLERYNGNTYKAVVFSNHIPINFIRNKKNIFKDNVGTPLCMVLTVLSFSGKVNGIFNNNMGYYGGAILIH